MAHEIPAHDASSVPADAIPAAEHPLRQLWASFSENRGAVLGLAILCFVAFLAIFAGILAPHGPLEQFRDAVRAPPVWVEGGSWRFILGTDGLGRDMLSRLMYGARVSLFIGLVVMGVSFVIGVLLGLIAAFSSPIVDTMISRSMDLIMAVPGLVLAILIVAVLGPSLTNTVVAVTVARQEHQNSARRGFFGRLHHQIGQSRLKPQTAVQRPRQPAGLDPKGTPGAGDQRGVAHQGCHRARVQRGRHHQKLQIAAQDRPDLQCQGQSQIGVQTALVKLVEDQQSNPGQFGV